VWNHRRRGVVVWLFFFFSLVASCELACLQSRCGMEKRARNLKHFRYFFRFCRISGLEQPPPGFAKGRGEGEGPPERAREKKVQCTQSCGPGECSRYKKLSDVIRVF